MNNAQIIENLSALLADLRAKDTARKAAAKLAEVAAVRQWDGKEFSAADMAAHAVADRAAQAAWVAYRAALNAAEDAGLALRAPAYRKGEQFRGFVAL